MGVVDRHPELELVVPTGPDPQDAREDQRVAHLPVLVVFRPALEHAALDDPVAKGVEADLLVLAGEDDRPRLAHPAAQEPHVVPVEVLHMVRVHGVLHDLQPVAGQEGVADIAEGPGPDEQVVAGQERSRVGAQVGPDEPAQLLGPVGDGPHLAREHRLAGLGRHLEARALAVELPAVVGAADAFLVDDRVDQRRPPVGALLLEEAEATPPVAEEDEVLAQQADLLGRPGLEFDGGGDGEPIAPEQGPHRRARPHPCQQLVLLRREHDEELYAVFRPSEARRRRPRGRRPPRRCGPA